MSIIKEQPRYHSQVLFGRQRVVFPNPAALKDARIWSRQHGFLRPQRQLALRRVLLAPHPLG
jgi:hypothetical protein